MKPQLEQKTTSHFLLRLSSDEKRKLQMLAIQKNTTITSLIRYLLSNNKTIESI